MCADYIFKSNYIFTGLDTGYISGAVAVKGNKILSAGREDEISKYMGVSTRVVECGDRLVMPGFIDAHCHFADAAQLHSKYTVNLFGTKSAQECLDRVAAFRKEFPDFKRIYGFGWSLAEWGKDAKRPTKEMIDAVVSDIPVYLQPNVAHFMWANSKALEESEVGDDTSFMLGGPERGDGGELTGMVIEIAAISKMVVNAHELPMELREEITLPLMQRLNASGITSVAVVSGETFPCGSFSDYECYKSLDEKLEHGIPVRMNLFPSLGYDGDFELAEKLREKYHADKVKVCGLKQFVDGVPQMHTAYLMEPYVDDPKRRGGTFYPAGTYRDVITKANARGFGVRMHALGDAAVKFGLDAYEASYRQNPDMKVVNTLEHIDVIREEDIPRFAQLNVVASMQPSHLNLIQCYIDDYYGRERMKRAFTHRALRDEGTVLAFGTDFPCVDFDPFSTIYYAVTRCDFDGNPISENPDQAVTLGETLMAYTRGSALAINRADELGTLEPGKFADIIVIDGPMFGEKPEVFLRRKVSMTMVDGVFVYENNQDNISQNGVVRTCN